MANTVSFNPAGTFGVCSAPYSVAVGDFNGDGKPDLVAANALSNNVSLLLNNGSGGFTSAGNFGVGDNPYSVAVGDFNGDGKPDIVSANAFSNNVSLLLNTTVTNQPPVANADTVSAAKNTAIDIAVATLLGNDTDANNDPLSITGVSNPTNGTAVLNNNGTPSNSSDDFITFTPSNGFSGTASFGYTLSDGKGGTAAATVTVAVGTVQTGGNSRDTLTGNAGNDHLAGNNGDDTLSGLAGDDTLLGGNGDDRLRGGTGNDILNGGLGNDLFILAATEGRDTVQDFTNGSDRFGLAGGLTFGQLTIAQSGSNTLISLTNGGEVLASLSGVNANLIDATDFIAA